MAGTTMIPVSVLVVTKNAGLSLAPCLEALKDFDEVIVVDSNSVDETVQIAPNKNVPVISYVWDGRYPKKRQWCLENVETKNEWIFFVDADEIVTSALAKEIAELIQNPRHDAYFIKGQPVFLDKVLNYGRWNNKITLFKKSAICYPVLSDAHLLSMGEMEGHYQPRVTGTTGQLISPLKHYCCEEIDQWIDRHQRYAAWQAEIEECDIDLSQTEKGLRRAVKKYFQQSALRPLLAFVDSYFLKMGCLDGKAGFHYAVARAWYYWLISVRKSVRAYKVSDSASEISMPIHSSCR